MSASYIIDGVTVTPQAGGYYELVHPGAPTERVRGKEHADTRAKAIAAAAIPTEGSMEQQPPIDFALPQDLQAAVDTAEQPAPPAALSPEVATLLELVAKQSAQIEALLAQAATTVITDGAPVHIANPLAQLPREYSGQVDDRTREAAAALGVTYVTIILEEGSDIPPTGLFIGHNGNSYMITPGEKVDVPDFLLGVLDDAIMSAPVVDSKTQKVLGYRNRTKYPYRRV